MFLATVQNGYTTWQTVIPEPAALATLGLATAPGLIRRRRHA